MIQLSLFSSLIKFIKSLFIQITVNKFRSPPSSFYIKFIDNSSEYLGIPSVADPAPRHLIVTRHQSTDKYTAAAARSAVSDFL